MRYGTQGFSAQQTDAVRRFRRVSEVIQILMLTRDMIYSDEIQSVKLLLSSLNGSWQNQFDHIWSKVFSTSPKYVALRSLISIISDSTLAAALANISLAEIEDLLAHPPLSPRKLTALYAIIQIASNPVGYNKQIQKIARLNVKQLFIVSQFYLPVLARALGRMLSDTCNYRGIYGLRNIVWQQEVQDPPSTAIDPFSFYAFGHQVVYFNFYKHINNQNSKVVYHVKIDPRTVANRPLLIDQINAGFPVEPIDLLSYGSSSYRGWDLTTSGPLREHIDECSELSDYEIVMITHRSRLGPRDLFESEHFSIPPRQAENKYVRQFLNSRHKFYAASWRTDAFKGETTIFNAPRNSNEDEVVSALLMFAEKVKYHVVVICQPSLVNCERINASSWLHLLCHCGEYSHNDYLSLLARSSGFLTGPSGAQPAGSVLYDKCTLVFDTPWYVNPDIFYDSNSVFLYKNIKILDPSRGLHRLRYNVSQGSADKLPHDGIRLREMGIEFTPLCQNDLFKAFLIFHQALHVSHCHSGSHIQKSRAFFAEIDKLSVGSDLKFSFLSAYRDQSSINPPKS